MRITELEAKAQIATDLFEAGAARVKITGTDIEVVWKEYVEATTSGGTPVSQAVNVNVSAVAQASISVSQSIEQILTDLPTMSIDPAIVGQAREQLEKLREESKRRRPRWNVVKSVLQWALEYSTELSLRLAPVVVAMMAQGHATV